MLTMVVVLNSKILLFRNQTKEQYLYSIKMLEQVLDKGDKRVTLIVDDLPVLINLNTLNCVTYEME